MTISYSLKKGLLGRHAVLYECPACKTDLQSSLEEAGTDDRCPRCQNLFVVPGASELAKLRNRAQLDAALRDREKRLASQERQASQEREQRAREVQKRAEEEEDKDWRERQQAAMQGRPAATTALVGPAGDAGAPGAADDGVGLIIGSLIPTILAGIVFGISFTERSEDPRPAIIIGAALYWIANMLFLAGVIRWGVSGAELRHMKRLEKQNQRMIELLERIHAAGSAPAATRVKGVTPPEHIDDAITR